VNRFPETGWFRAISFLAKQPSAAYLARTIMRRTKVIFGSLFALPPVFATAGILKGAFQTCLPASLPAVRRAAC
jgi:hypothetical protein